MSVAKELALSRSKQIVIVYEPLTNRRQHFMKEQYIAAKKRWAQKMAGRVRPAAVGSAVILAVERATAVAPSASVIDTLIGNVPR